jgi:hypothetical protein
MPLPEFTQATMGQRRPEYITWASLCVAMNIATYVELGSGSAHYIKRAGAGRVISVDINNVDGGKLHNPHREDGVVYYRGNSHDPDILREIIDLLDGMPDAVFIDADHDGDAPRRDFELWWPNTRMLLGFHDIQIPNVASLWREISLHIPSVKLIGCDRESAVSWQGMGCPQDGVLSAGGIGVVFK